MTRNRHSHRIRLSTTVLKWLGIPDPSVGVISDLSFGNRVAIDEPSFGNLGVYETLLAQRCKVTVEVVEFTEVTGESLPVGSVEKSGNCG